MFLIVVSAFWSGYYYAVACEELHVKSAMSDVGVAVLQGGISYFLGGGISVALTPAIESVSAAFQKQALMDVIWSVPGLLS